MKIQQLIKVKRFNPTWEEGMLLFMMAFHWLPDNFEEWNIGWWESINKLAKQKIESDAKRMM